MASRQEVELSFESSYRQAAKEAVASAPYLTFADLSAYATGFRTTARVLRTIALAMGLEAEQSVFQCVLERPLKLVAAYRRLLARIATLESALRPFADIPVDMEGIGNVNPNLPLDGVWDMLGVDYELSDKRVKMGDVYHAKEVLGHV